VSESVLPEIMAGQVAIAQDIALVGRAGGDISGLVAELKILNAEFASEVRLQSKERFIERKTRMNRESASRLDESLVSKADIQEFAADVGAVVDAAANAAGEVAQDIAAFGDPTSDGIVAGAYVHTATAVVGGVLTGGVTLTGEVVGIPDKTESAVHNLAQLRRGNWERGLAGAGEFLEVAGILASAGLLFLGGRQALQGRTSGTPTPAPKAPAAGGGVGDDVARAEYNGVKGPVQQVSRTARDGTNAVRQTFPNGSVKDISRARVKEFVPSQHPKAPPGTLQKVKFDNALPGSKGYKRPPTAAELTELR